MPTKKKSKSTKAGGDELTRLQGDHRAQHAVYQKKAARSLEQLKKLTVEVDSKLKEVADAAEKTGFHVDEKGVVHAPRGKVSSATQLTVKAPEWEEVAKEIREHLVTQREQLGGRLGHYTTAAEHGCEYLEQHPSNTRDHSYFKCPINDHPEFRMAINELEDDRWCSKCTAIRSKFEQMYSQLSAYRDKHGDCLVPFTWKKSKPPTPTWSLKLARWVSALRRRNSKGDLVILGLQSAANAIDLPICEMCASHLGIVDGLHDLTHVYGANTPPELECHTCESPRKLTRREFDGLLQLGEMLDAFAKDTGLDLRLPGERVKKSLDSLQELEFVWDLRVHSFMEKYDQLVAYRDKYGDCRVPRGWTDEEGSKGLANWVAGLRRRRRNDQLAADEIHVLNSIGFDWLSAARSDRGRTERLSGDVDMQDKHKGGTYLSELRIQNFKAFREAQVLPLAPITLLFGRNSVGKSSVLQSLKMLRQTIDADERPDDALLPSGNLVDLGNYKNFVHGQKSKRHVRLGYRFGNRLLNGSAEDTGQDMEELWCEFDFKLDEHDRVQLNQYIFGSGDWSQNLASYSMIPRRSDSTALESIPRRQRTSGTLRLTEINAESPSIQQEWNYFHSELTNNKDYLERRLEQKKTEIERHEARILEQRAYKPEEKSLRRVVRTRESRRELEKHLDHAEARKKHIERLLDEISNDSYDVEGFVKTLRTLNNADLSTTHFLPTHVKTTGGRHLTRGRPLLRELDFVTSLALTHPQWLMKALSRLESVASFRPAPESFHVDSYAGASLHQLRRTLAPLNYWFEQLGIPYKVSLPSIDDSGLFNEFRIQLTDRNSGLNLRLIDVGFGIGHILPVLLECLGRRNSLILVEEPEIHMHPRAQAEFGTFLAGCIKVSEPSQYIVETHSEHLVLRLQRLIRTGELTPEQVSIIYFKKDEGVAKAFPVSINDEGEFTDAWPDGFFPERLDEILG